MRTSLPVAGVIIAVWLGTAASTQSASPLWGRLANPALTNQRIKATYFFSGQALDGSNWYNATPAPICDAPNCSHPAYTLHPADSRQLRWSESVANRYAALDAMLQVGINVIHLSCWGDDVPNAWVTGAAPMQSSRASHDELFDAVAGRPLVIIPFLEERGGAAPWAFKDEFPTTPDGRLAPGTIVQIEYLVRHYLQDPAHPQWSNRWARLYDSKGGERFAIGIIHAASNRLGSGDHVAFAWGFDAVAAQVLRDTGVKVGFLIDPLPPVSAQAFFYPLSDATGRELAATDSLLCIAGFVPEVYLHRGDTAGVLDWKRSWAQGWFQSGVPFLMDLSSGYDGRIVFGTDWYYGLDQPVLWLCGLDQLIRDFGQSGIIFNSWNGYTEGMVALPTQETGTIFYDWLRSLFAADVFAQRPDAPAPRNGHWCSAYNLAEAVQNVPNQGIIGLLPTTPAVPFAAPITIAKPCTVKSLGGLATIGL